MRRLCGWLVCSVPLLAWAQVPTLELEPYLRQPVFQRVKISPDGAYYAVTTALEDRTALAVVRADNHQPTAKVVGKRGSVVEDFWWANDERIVVSLATRRGSRDEPVSIGELHAVNADGSNPRLLASPYGARGPLDTTVQLLLEPSVYLFDTLPGDRRKVLVYAVPQTSDPNVRVERLDIYTGGRDTVAMVPVRRARFLADAQGRVRFASGANADNVQKLFYRDDDGSAWRHIDITGSATRNVYALGFSEDGRVAYLQVEQPDGPDAVVAWDPASGRTTELLRDARVDPYRILYALDGRTPIGVSFMSDRVRNRFFDDNHPAARLYRSLEPAFDGDAIHITSTSADGRLALVSLWSDRNSGDYILFDTVSKTGRRIFSQREWLHPADMLGSREIAFDARDGRRIHGYLTLPRDASGPRPLVVLPHGGPFGIFDSWSFDDDTQLLAAAGYAVLRVNYRGSGNYGRAHLDAGAQEWGGAMQDDLTDATRWAIQTGVAEPDRICIYGASYGGYAALMGAAREPDLYQCAVGYVGVYDLEMFHRDQSGNSRSSRTWAGEWMGARGTLAARSPVNLADRIRVPVFLAAGGQDTRAPLAHSQRMERALKRNGGTVETLYYPNEGHGFYTEAHRRAFYTRLLGFLSTHLGGAVAR
ncbi:alpha/beta hydrolase family protein [Luteimonas deserti]|uniref:S9 family peptidase n=1 Tax=Luteimonas deserti TaxID=2752306 RepID=A0A7Z0QN07_9GAMM|nr:S9 family peptidase [Luteimonas deserti]NYZ61584.1 S9 family peptidase [Luteimonas deserti]